ncbi:sigma-70 family RNA polymerase sigma factor [Paraneptunicella aestuarii]|uniref:RNA polymerase sigma factor n=1 Tax=Paraneptunicella aestuarii TaxID=2831148 RepID=UPI001E41A0F1|nr:sigma-70 family RNA polymerase sigma factor [Paraneptunicella aestuarii]UAA37411.1 sigma-70 family RNA polymerase sigma factor [Paraneptunicella aestuarii]
MNHSDNDLIAVFLTNSDEDAFNQLVTRYQSQVRQFLRRLTAGDHALADDLAQETFMKMFSSLNSFRGDSKLSTWLHKIAYHCFLRSQEKDAKYELIDDSNLHSPAPFITHETNDIMLEQLMAKLSIDERTMLTLAYAAGMSHSEIATVTGSAIGTIKSHITRGKAKLTQILNNEEAA